MMATIGRTTRMCMLDGPLRRGAVVLCLWALAACSGGASGAGADLPPSDAGVDVDPNDGRVRLRFEIPRDGPADFGSLPWPSDLYMDDDGRIAVGRLPGDDASDLSEQYMSRLRGGLSELDGFGATTPIYFFFDGEIDVGSLPDGADGTLLAGATVFLLDVDANSPAAFERVAVQLRYDNAQRRLALRPKRGSALVPGRRYAAVVTAGLRAADGGVVAPSAEFAAVRSLRPAGNAVNALDAGAARSAQVRENYGPVFDALERAGTQRAEVLGLAVFRVQTVPSMLTEALQAVSEQPPVAVLDAPRDDLDSLLGTPAQPAAGLDVAGGVLHSGIGAMVQGRFMTRNYASPSVGVHGRFQRDDAGMLRVQRTEDVPFTLWLPAADVSVAKLPLVVYQHGLGTERSQSVVLANRLCAAGYAVVAMDLPYHGGRSAIPDARNGFTGAEGADGFGDGSGDFAGLGDGQAAGGPLLPRYYRAAVFQSLLDLSGMLRALRALDWSAALAGSAYEGTALDTERLGFVGVGLGGELGLALAARELDLGIGAVEALWSGAHITENWSAARGRQSLFRALAASIGKAAQVPIEGGEALVAAQWWPGLSLYQTMVDTADPMVLAAGLRRLPVNALLVAAEHDANTTPASSEALARAIGAMVQGRGARWIDDLASVDGRSPVSGNFAAGDDTVTRVMAHADGATERAHVARAGMRTHALGIDGIYTELATPEPLQEPIDALLDQAQVFSTTYRACQAQGSVCPATVAELP